MTSTVIVIENGGVSEVEIEDEGFTITVDGDQRSPAVTTQIESEDDGERSSITDQCGNTQSFTSSQRPATLTVQGIVAEGSRDGALSKDDMLDLKNGQMYDIECDLFGGRMELTNRVVTQSNEVKKFRGSDMGEPRKAYEFQLQFGEQESSN